MSISVVQSLSVVNTTGTTTAITVASTGSGNLLAITFIGEASSGSQYIVSITDNKSNTYALATGSQCQSNPYDSEIWYCNNATAGVTTVTVTIESSVGSGDCVIGFIEISGQATSSVLEVGTQYAATVSPEGPSTITASNGSILLATCFPVSTGATAVMSPWTAFASSLKFNAYYIPGAAGTYQCLFQTTSPQFQVSSGASFLPPSSGPSGAQQASTFLVF